MLIVKNQLDKIILQAKHKPYTTLLSGHVHFGHHAVFVTEKRFGRKNTLTLLLNGLKQFVTLKSVMIQATDLKWSRM
jgi:hypothetical protein